MVHAMMSVAVGFASSRTDDQSHDEKDDRCLTTHVWVVSPTTRNRPTNVQAICSVILSLVSMFFLYLVDSLPLLPPLPA
jgi:hypothetical protein